MIWYNLWLDQGFPDCGPSLCSRNITFSIESNLLSGAKFWPDTGLSWWTKLSEMDHFMTGLISGQIVWKEHQLASVFPHSSCTVPCFTHVIAAGDERITVFVCTGDS